jgi:hypothetical protein
VTAESDVVRGEYGAVEIRPRTDEAALQRLRELHVRHLTDLVATVPADVATDLETLRDELPLSYGTELSMGTTPPAYAAYDRVRVFVSSECAIELPL